TAILVVLLPLAAQAFFWGNSCGCQPARCAVPACPLPPAPVCPPPPVCGAPSGYATAPQYAPVQQAQPQYYQQLPVAGYAHQPSQPIAQYVGEGQLAAHSENQELETSGQSATLGEEEEAAPAAAAAAPEAPAATTDDVDAVDAAPAPAAPAGESATAAQNTVYDDIVNAAQGSTPAEEYHAAAAAASRRRRYHSIRRAPAAFDPKCNSETLKNIIHQNIGDSTSSSKRQIQKAASEEVGGHVDVICSTGTFSYIVNTELYCETEKDGITCFAFRQSN
ncbi:hypothetical protein PFISCL1PPCAC_3646, partial [Pristionchus fissidentatus]